MRLFFLPCVIVTAFILFSLTNVYSQDKKAETKESSSFSFPEPVTTKHTITLEGKRLNYTATVGHTTMLDDKQEKLSHIFYTAYTLDQVGDKSKRPVTFVFNGGPGSSSVWLHMGALGPKRILMNDDGSSVPPPYQIVDNEYSWLDKTDLVFIDPVETGYSRPASGVDKKEFTGYKEDLESVGDFIHKYITKNGRWNSPKYLAGESYGTTRASGLSGYLQDRHGMFLNGLILISSIMNFQTAYFTVGNDLPYSLFLPSFAASAYHHNKIDKTKYPNFDAFIKEVENFAQGEYTLYLMKGDLLTKDEKDELANKLSAYMGVNQDFFAKPPF
jgi:carboxypeptidase C (cathepsin A)